MTSGKGQHKILNYSDLFLNDFFDGGLDCTHQSAEHFIVFVYSGELIILEGKEKISVKSGESVFIRRNTQVTLLKRGSNGKPFHGIFMGFSKSFLSEFYNDFRKKQVLSDGSLFEAAIMKLPKTPYIQSLHISMVPYFEWGIKPTRNVLELKLREGIYCLLLLDNRFFSCLFDFVYPWQHPVNFIMMPN